MLFPWSFRWSELLTINCCLKIDVVVIGNDAVLCPKTFFPFVMTKLLFPLTLDTVEDVTPLVTCDVLDTILSLGLVSMGGESVSIG